MGIDLIIKIAGVGILSSVVSQILKNLGKDDIATFTTLASVIVVLIMLISSIAELFESVKTIFSLFVTFVWVNL